MSVLHSWLRIPPADEPVARWHVSPVVDVVAYAFSWLWVLVPLVFLTGETHPIDYLALYFLVTSLNFTHRHFTLPYVYLDRQIFRQFPWRFTVFPAVMFAAFAASPSLWAARLPARSLAPVDLALLLVTGLVAVQAFDALRRRARPRVATVGSFALPALALAAWMPFRGATQVGPGSWPWLVATMVVSLALTARFGLRGRQRQGAHVFLSATVILVVAAMLVLDPGGTPTLPTKPFPWYHALAGVAFFAGVWNVWHVYSQKYGILRVYNAKSGAPAKVPGWIDRWLIFGWVPLYFAWLGPHYRSTALERFATARDYLIPLLNAMESAQVWLVPLSIASVVGSIGAFLWHERRVNGLRNAPRLWMAAGMTGLSASFLLFNPVKVYMAYAFSHALEYMVFVWAFQRKRYREPLPHRPLLQRALRHPLIAYGGFTVLVAGGYLLLRFWGRYFMTEQDFIHLAGVPAFRWVFYWGVYQSMVHFYFDGFLWKMRVGEVRGNL